MGNIAKIGAAGKKRLIEMWNSGFQRKVIAHELGVSVVTLDIYRKKLDLPERRLLMKIKKRRFTVELTEEQYHALLNVPNKGNYIRGLIQRDLAVWSCSGHPLPQGSMLNPA